MLILNVPYKEKDQAKALGAKWNPDIKKWYVQNRQDYVKFCKWVVPQGNIIVCNNLYVLEGRQSCFKCGKETRVIGFGIEDFYDFSHYDVEESSLDEVEYWSGVIRMAGHINPIPEKILIYLQKNYNYKMRYSKTTNESHINNCCDNCDVLQGDFYLFSEVDSPFWIDSEEKVKALKIYKIPLKQDIIIDANIGYSNTDEWLKLYGNIELLDIEKYIG